MIPTTPHSPPAPRPSFWATAAGLIALALLYYICGGLPLVPFLALGLVGVYFTNARLETDSYLRWMVRIALIALVYQISQHTDPNRGSTGYIIGSSTLRAMFGQLYAAEMVVQAWRRRDAGGWQASLAVALFSGLIYLTACNTDNDRVVILTTPVYMLFVAFALRDWRSRERDVRPGTAARTPTRWLTAAQRVTVIVGTLLIAAGLQRGVFLIKDRLNDVGTHFAGDSSFLETVGMSSQPQLGSTFGLRGSSERVLRIKNPVGDTHLRGATFSIYNEGRWGPALNKSVYVPASADDLSPLKPLYGPNGARGRADETITRLTNLPLLFAPLNNVGLTTGESTDASDKVEWAPNVGGVLRNRAKAPYLYIVGVSTDQPTYQGPFCQPVLDTQDKRAPFLQVPTDQKGGENADGQYMRALAGTITASARTTPEKIEAVTQYLLKNHHYSLTIRLSHNADPIAEFLREKKDAHCEFFAASASLLLRYAGVPTRYATGYLAHEEGTTPNELIVRQRDAHAWCEAWVDGTGWVCVDATPGDGRPDHMGQDSISPFQKIGEWFSDLWQSVKDRLADLPPAVLNALVIASALLPLGIYILTMTLKARKRRRAALVPPFVYTADDAALAALGARFEAAFQKAGQPLPPDRTYSDVLREPATAALTETGRQFARAYDEARFGGRRDPATFDELTRLVSQVERDAASAATGKKKL